MMKGEIHNEIFNNIPYLVKDRLHVDYLQDGNVMYNDKVIFLKREVLTHIHESMMPMDCYQNNLSLILQLVT